mmetsp:Transcript_7209/g.10547  ORF Transcript_7209/g.10547 Transcript_7209/m.10547 type:complete len:321 (-) Transcript_7209:2153-3115(-)
MILQRFIILIIYVFFVPLAIGSSWDTTNTNESGSSCYYYSNRVEATFKSSTSAHTKQCFSKPSMPTMDLDHIALCLRHNCEINRRLQQGSQIKASTHDEYENESCVRASGSSDIIEQTRGGQVSIHPSQFWHPPIPPSLQEDEWHLSVFHAETSIPGKGRQGASRWGMDLHEYVERVTTALDVKDDPLVLALAMVYLDRASSVETSRIYTAAAPCPFLSPRTVHRLFLTSLVIASKAVHPEMSTETIYESLVSQNIAVSPEQLHEMERWMRHGLGDNQVYVSDQELEDFRESWDNWERLWSKPKVRVKGVSRRLVRPVQS